MSHPITIGLVCLGGHLNRQGLWLCGVHCLRSLLFLGGLATSSLTDCALAAGGLEVRLPLLLVLEVRYIDHFCFVHFVMSAIFTWVGNSGIDVACPILSEMMMGIACSVPLTASHLFCSSASDLLLVLKLNLLGLPPLWLQPSHTF